MKKSSKRILIGGYRENRMKTDKEKIKEFKEWLEQEILAYPVIRLEPDQVRLESIVQALQLRQLKTVYKKLLDCLEIE